MEKSNLNQPANVSLVEAGTVAAMADREGWSAEDYVIKLAEQIRHPGVSLDFQRERLLALASLGPDADSTGGAALAHHFQLLEAMFMRFSLEAGEALQRGGHKTAEVAERYTSAAVRAQGAALRCLSALKALRDAPSGAGTGCSSGNPDNVEVRDIDQFKSN
jgi:hypothetical protein